MFRNPDLARSLPRIAARGRDGYYKGPTADAIVAVLAERGSPMTAEDLAEFEAEWVQPISTTYRGWTVSEIPPNGQGIAALIMLNLMETFPMGDFGFHSPHALHTMIEAKKLAYADLLRYVGDPRMAQVPVPRCSTRPAPGACEDASTRRARSAGCSRRNSSASPTCRGTTPSTCRSSIATATWCRSSRATIRGSAPGWCRRAPASCCTTAARCSRWRRRSPTRWPAASGPLHTIIPGFMEKDGTRISFGIMGGWNQAQAHAQFVADVADFGFTAQEALEAGRFTKATFDGCDVQIEAARP